ncbi:exosome complex exonuclease DIS3 [Vairimorpha necatrix]|uniref:Exosome complex exonuclease DIS3 n=1 Tax=Vairimorpha necatrix TaxID=6039 RepID=A0AAX4JFJ5_9MICR
MEDDPKYKYSNSIYEYKISKRNQLIKRVKEIYVRKNIPCGFSCCSSPIYSEFVVFSIISKEIMEKHKSLLKSDFIRPIICQSEFLKLSMGDQRRIMEIINKKFYVFFYDHFSEYTNSKGLEGVLDFYKEHLPDRQFIIINLENIKKYPEYFNTTEYCDNIEIIKDLVEDEYIKEDTEYEEYYTNFSENIYKSTLMVDTYNWRNGTIFSQNKRIRILGSRNMNRAIHGDEVYVELIDEIQKDEIDLENDEIDNKKQKNIKINQEDKKDTLFGKVVGISKRGRTELIGTILNSTVNGDGPQNVLVLPIDKKYPPVRIRTSQPEELINRRLYLEIEFWDKDSKYPGGHYFKKMSEIGNVEGEIKCILLSNNISYSEINWEDLISPGNFYDTETLKALKNEKSEYFSLESIYKEVENKVRRDLRHLNIFSVDPEGCTDVDDALHIRKLENGNFEVGVHIADVSHYVKPGSALDSISSDRGTTVYLPDRRIDMLPEFLSAGLCSLLENQERGTFSVIWEIDENANILNTEFTKGLIKSCKAFSYEEALNLLESNDTSDIKQDLVNLYEISKKLRNKRQENGALDLSASKIEIKNKKIIQKDSIITNTLIEEFMLLANISVAEFLYKNYPENALLRKHPPPSEVEMPLDINLKNSKNVNEVLSKLNPEKSGIFKKIITKAMNQATYVLSSEETDFNHYGLATPLYTHFTSPIRRYADILVHRSLNYILNKEKEDKKNIKRLKSVNEINTNELDNINGVIINNINMRHSSARRCAWDVSTLFIYEAIKQIEPVTHAYVTEIKSNGYLIFIPEYGINGAITFEEGKIKVFDKFEVKIVKDDERFYLRRRFNITII